MLQTDVQNRQNEDLLLKCQYVARYYYNKAELSNLLSWIAVLISTLCIFLPDTDNYFFLAIPLVTDVFAFCFSCLMNASIDKGAKLRQYFDAYVLNLDYSIYTDFQKSAIKEIIAKVTNTHKEDCQIQIQNTGHDNPPGVRNWYEFNREFSDEDVLYECQVQNCWWDKKMCKLRLYVYIIIFILSIIALVIFKSSVSNKYFVKIIICSSGIIIRIAERLVANYKYYQLSLKIDGALQATSTSKNINSTLSIQEMLNTRRQMPVLGMNFIHKSFAPKLSKLYNQIS